MLIRLFVIAFLSLLAFPSWAAIAIDGGSSTSAPSSNAYVTAITTSISPDVIIVFACNDSNATVATISHAASLTWHLRQSQVYNTTQVCEEWYAIANSTLSTQPTTLRHYMLSRRIRQVHRMGRKRSQYLDHL